MKVEYCKKTFEDSIKLLCNGVIFLISVKKQKLRNLQLPKFDTEKQIINLTISISIKICLFSTNVLLYYNHRRVYGSGREGSGPPADCASKKIMPEYIFLYYVIVFNLVLNVFLLFWQWLYFLIIIKKYSYHCEFCNINNECFFMSKNKKIGLTIKKIVVPPRPPKSEHAYDYN